MLATTALWSVPLIAYHDPVGCTIGFNGVIMAMSSASKGCITLLGSAILLVLFVKGVGTIARWAGRTAGPKPTPAPTMTAAEIIREQARQRDAAWRKEKLREVIARQRAEAARERRAAEAAWLETPAGLVWRDHRDWSREDCRLIADGKLHLGFTEEQCVAAWGQPDSARRSINPGNTTALLCYGQFCKSALYFVDGRLLRIEQ